MLNYNGSIEVCLTGENNYMRLHDVEGLQGLMGVEIGTICKRSTRLLVSTYNRTCPSFD